MLSMKKTFRGLTALLASATMVLAPVAQGANAQQRREKLMQDYLKMTGLAGAKPVTVGEFYYKFREWYPESVRGSLDRWVLQNKNQMMPKMDVQPVKDAEDRLQYRILLRDGEKSITLMTGEDFLKIGTMKLTNVGYYDAKNFVNQLAESEPYLAKTLKGSKDDGFTPDIVLSATEFRRLKVAERAVYFLQLRRTLQDAEKILNAVPGASKQKNQKEKKTAMLDGGLEVVANWLMGLPAFAKVAAGESCVVAGFVSKYGENLSCGGKQSGTKDFNEQVKQQLGIFKQGAANCSGGGLPCNPMVYGFDGGGNVHCVGRDVVNAKGSPVTAECNKMSPLRKDNPKQLNEDRQRILQSWVKAMGNDTELQFNEEGKIHEDQYGLVKDQLEGLNSFIKEAKDTCQSEKGRKLRKERKDQDSACTAIEVRMMELAKFKIPVVEITCDNGFETDNGKCVCKAPKSEMDIEGQKVCGEKPVVQEPPPRPPGDIPNNDDDDNDEPPPPPKPAKEECGWFCRNGTTLLIGGGLLVGIGLFAWWMTRDDKKAVAAPVYVPPVPPPLPAVTPPPTTPVTPPPPPPPPVSTEGGTGTSPINSGGVRNGNR